MSSTPCRVPAMPPCQRDGWANLGSSGMCKRQRLWGTAPPDPRGTVRCESQAGVTTTVFVCTGRGISGRAAPARPLVPPLRTHFAPPKNHVRRPDPRAEGGCRKPQRRVAGHRRALAADGRHRPHQGQGVHRHGRRPGGGHRRAGRAPARARGRRRAVPARRV